MLHDCHISLVIAPQSQGMGCIELPATQQKTLLLMTTTVLWLALFCQLADFCLLFFNDKKSKGCQKTVKVQRPWLTMFFDMVILIVRGVIIGLCDGSFPVGVIGNLGNISILKRETDH